MDIVDTNPERQEKTMDLIKIQNDLEDHMVSLGVSRYHEQNSRLVSRGEGSLTKANLKLSQGLLPEVARNLSSWMEDQAFDGRGRRNTALLPIKTLGVEVCAAIGVSSALDGLSKDLRDRALTIGRMVETELQFKHLEKLSKSEAAALFKFRTTRWAGKKLNAKVRADAVEPWIENKRAVVGTEILNAVLKTGILETVKVGGQYALVLTEAGQRFVREVDNIQQYTRPFHMPMVVPPLKWLGLKDGGYRTAPGRRYTEMVKIRTRNVPAYNAAIKNGSMKPFVDALNTIQETPWSINQDILDLVTWAFEEGHGKVLDGFPKNEHVPAYQFPENLEDLDQAVKQYHYRQARTVHQVNETIDGEYVVFRNDIETAEYFKDFDAFWLPHNVDSRGRVYAIPHFNYQRSDHIKAMFQFAEGKPLGEHGRYWLSIHLANCGDFDKVSKKSFDDRYQWVIDNQHQIVAVGTDPQGTFDYWSQADKPFCFVAACIDLTRALGNDEYISHLPIALDGSNSGVQHYSMALRSAEEGRMVCLADLEAPEDIYRTVATASARMVQSDLEGSLEALKATLYDTIGKGEQESPKEYEAKCQALAEKTKIAAAMWADWGVDRSVVKRNVMTFSYSSGLFGFANQIVEDLMRPLNDKVLRGEIPGHPFDIDGDGGWFAARYLAKKNWEAVTGTISKAAEGMTWLKRAAQLMAHEGKPMSWVTPVGFPVRNLYTEQEMSRVSVFVLDRNLSVDASTAYKVDQEGDPYRRITMNLSVGATKKIKKAKSASTIAPNVIHSMDASHLMLTVNQAKNNGIDNFQLIHDSFATHAGDTEKFFWIIREALVDMYQNLDLFGYLYETVSSELTEEGRAKLPQPPKMGTLDLEVVRRSLYSFA